MRRTLALSAVAVSLLLAACGTTQREEGAPAERVGTSKGAIINGVADTTHQAVVAIYSQAGREAGLCSGTIVKVDAEHHIGWVATAAHCVDVSPVLVFQGDDFGKPDAIKFEVIDFKADPVYTGETGSPHDFAMVRIAGVDENTPTIPLVTSPDGLTNGTQVMSVGYGRTTLLEEGQPTADNTVRRRLSKTVPLNQVTTTHIGYNMSQTGICQGDSGGPVLIGTGASEKVVGIHSFVQGDCDGQGVSGRVTSGLSFYNGEMNKALPADDCNLCEKVANSGSGECAVLTQKCFADPDCKGYYDCLSARKPKATCLKEYPKAEGPFNALGTCVCNRACTDKCGSTLACKTTPKCGYKLEEGECATCTEGACCQETLDCASDGTCYLCLKSGDAEPECAENATRKKLATCVASSCKDQCAGSGLENGADPNAENNNGGGTKTTTTTSGCSVTRGDVGGGAASPFAALALGAAVAFGLRRSRQRRSSV